ncbi:MAG TPA: FAD-dependent oxidoreductase [Pyrinomonadaceae bacterium]|nr:FAD-dependent oxidoreductase [Pyrinomonadaceae bacterium]HMP66409.1 FAD-dependent oxidoreductase [Pyrinomonadaceae bacterium]
MEVNSHIFDVAIVGAGPGGLAAAMWCDELGLETILINDRAEPGGQLHMIFGPVLNYPGLTAETGAELAERFAGSAARSGFERLYGERVSAIEPGSPQRLQIADGGDIYSRFVILASGLRRRTLGVPGEVEFAGRGILNSGVAELESVAGKRVVIVGGGDAALENAVLLGEAARRVTVVHRRKGFSARKEFVRAAEQLPNVEFIMGSVVEEIIGEGNVSGIRLTPAGGESRTIGTDFILIRIGHEPNSELLRDIVELDERGFVRVDINSETSRQGIFAVGDVAHPLSPTIATAVGMGAAAAKAIAAKTS